MGSIESPRALCISVHDVAPHNWRRCERLLYAIQAVAAVPVTLLVVPAYHHHAVADSPRYDRMLEHRLALGDELALHGYTHLDEGPAPAGWRDKFRRQVCQCGEGEFAALGLAQARQRLAWGLEWFARRNWPVQGFVAPGWLLSDGAAQALTEFPFAYTTTRSRFHFLPGRQSLAAPTLLYRARGRWGRMMSRGANSLWPVLLENAPLVRLALHPADADDPRTLDHVQNLIARLLVNRKAMTKASFARAGK